MFPVGRYDPNKKDQSSNGGNPKGNKRRRKGGPTNNGGGDNSEPPKSSLLRVIAPDETNHLPFASSKMAPRAVDDFDLLFPIFDNSNADSDEIVDVTEMDEGMVGTTAVTATTSGPTIGQADNVDEDGAGENDDGDDHDNHQTMMHRNVASVGQASPGEIKAALKIASLPLEQAAQVWKLAPFLVNNLKRDGFQHFFPIQALSIPDVIASERHYHVRAQDVCITAPTGSGKTLSFVLPVLNALADRQVCRLRALVVLPSRDLANQVYRVFESYVKGSNLKVGLAIGQSDFTAEQVALTVGDDDDNNNNDVDNKRNSFDTSDALQRLRFDPGNLELTLRAYHDADNPGSAATGSANTSSSSNKNQALKSGQSAIDILVCTPGRLVDHLDNTEGFTLQHLRFLVVDEADRLLNQSYHNWIGRVIDAASEASVNAWHEIEARGDNRLAPVIPEQQHNINSNSQVQQEPITWRRGGTAGDYSDFDANANSYFCPASLACRPVQLRKFLVSATLTRDPQKLAALRLVNPKHFDVHQLNMLKSSAAGNSDMNKSKQQRKHQFSVPIELEEFMVECTAEQKPIVLLSLLIEQLQQKSKSFMPLGDTRKGRNNVIVVFTASVDSTHRLARLLQLIWPSCTKLHETVGNDVRDDGPLGAVVEFSSALSQAERSALIQRCNDNSSSSNSSSSHGRDKNDISIVVCSDSMARGMDIEKCSTVINYDVPTLAKTYLHRVGRTARAGKSGVAISLLKSGQVAQFTRMRRLIHSPSVTQVLGNRSNSIVPTMAISKSLVRQLVPMYRNCIRGLKDVLEAEENGELVHTEPLSDEYFETSPE